MQIKDQQKRRHQTKMDGDFKHVVQMDKMLLKELEESAFYSL